MEIIPFLIIIFGLFYAFATMISLFHYDDGVSKRYEKRERKRRKQEAENKIELFNPKRERSTYVRILENTVYFKTDIQHVEVTSDALSVKVSSMVADQPLKFNLFVKPFSFHLLKTEDFIKHNLDSILTLEKDSNKTKDVLSLIDELKPIAKTIYDGPKSTYLYTTSYIIDREAGIIEIEGYFNDSYKFSLGIDSDNFKLYITAPVSALQNKNNFKDYDLFGLLP